MSRGALRSIVPVIAGTALLAGCGSSSSSSSTAGGSAQAATSTSAASSSPATTSTASSAAPSGKGIEVTTKKQPKLGTILAAGSKKLTVYLWEADKSSTSVCNGACAKVWPPVTTTGSPTASGSAVSGDLGISKRSDGTEQVTYKGHPLYYFIKDKDDGDAYGQGSNGFGAGWYVMKPNGSKIDNS